MNEFPRTYPDLDSFIQASSIISYSDIDALCREGNINPDPLLVRQVMQLMTPKEILEQIEHEREVITALNYPDFESLKQARAMIRDLRLVPERSDAVQAEYERMSRNLYLRLIREYYLNGSPISLVKEMYPSDLCPDVDQRVVWIKDDNTPDHFIAEFIAKAMRVSRLTMEDLILFERSRKTNTHLVKAAVPEFRHIHLWMNKKNGNFK